MFNHFNMLLDFLCYYFVEDFCLYIYKVYSSIISFSFAVFVVIFCILLQGLPHLGLAPGYGTFAILHSHYSAKN